MTLRRIAKLFAAQNTNQLVVMAQQLLLPPTFVRVFGVSMFGQWQVLTAAISYLGTFNYGLQTYTNMQMTIHYNGGELKECKEVQSAGLRILIGAFLVVAMLLSVVFLIPINSWLRLTIPENQAQWTLYLLGMQVMSNMVFGFFSGSYMVFGEAHRGQHYSSANQLLGTLTIVSLAVMRETFPIIAAGQVCVTLLFAIYLAIDVGRRCPDIRPSIRYWKPGSLSAVLKPSSQYMLLATSNMLSYQAPVILMQRFLGPTAVAIYTLTRTVYSMSRRVLYLVTNSLSQEITMVYGQKDWPKLHKLYALSERLVLLMTPPITFGCMLATPLIMQVWMHKGGLYQVGVCITLGLMVSVLSIKEHKYQFQFSSNQVSQIAWQTLAIYGLTNIVAIPFIIHFGVNGFLAVLLFSEVAQLFYLLRLNDRLFAGNMVLDHKPVYKMLAILAVCTVLIYWPMKHITAVPYALQGLIAIGVTLLIGAFCYWVFQVDEIRSLLWGKLASRIPALARRSAT